MQPKRLIVWAVVAVALVGLGFTLMRPAGEQRDIANEDLRRLADEGARIVDVRSQGEYEMGHIPGSENVPVDRIAAVADSWDRDTPVVLYCAVGDRSRTAMNTLAEMGFTKLYNLKAGIVAWDGESTTETAPPSAVIDTGDRPVFVMFTSDG